MRSILIIKKLKYYRKYKLLKNKYNKKFIILNNLYNENVKKYF